MHQTGGLDRQCTLCGGASGQVTAQIRWLPKTPRRPRRVAAEAHRRRIIDAISPLQTADRVSFDGLIDYAGLFPPALLSMEDAVAEYRRARHGPFSAVLARFICPASRLEELAGQLTKTMTSGERPWPVSAILDGDVAAAAVSARAFDAEMEPGAQIALLEVPLPLAASDGRAVAAASAEIAEMIEGAWVASPVATPFFEVQVGTAAEAGIPNALAALVEHRAIAHRPLGAKLRCGGATAAQFTSPEQVVAFIAACIRHRLPFKATAGLHHPVRHHDAELDVMRHGFLNLLTATAFAGLGWDRPRLQEVVEETDPTAFAVSVAGLAWRQHSVRVRDLRTARDHFVAYGSCSFDEPTQDLAALGMLRPTVGS